MDATRFWFSLQSFLLMADNPFSCNRDRLNLFPALATLQEKKNLLKLPQFQLDIPRIRSAATTSAFGVPTWDGFDAVEQARGFLAHQPVKLMLGDEHSVCTDRKILRWRLRVTAGGSCVCLPPPLGSSIDMRRNLALLIACGANVDCFSASIRNRISRRYIYATFQGYIRVLHLARKRIRSSVWRNEGRPRTAPRKHSYPIASLNLYDKYIGDETISLFRSLFRSRRFNQDPVVLNVPAVILAVIDV
ncbi:hypothetical protein F5146DRAFT_997439 [Armillaria mellea]|nr:hypothetical protein F5146DRAFT_997439 [Armillaria mellea]